ncbi:MOSC domain-containing protein [Luteipulveratus halotolerans]|uniref:MOSC domain-containing protein n=1 Tax=Luteipulveratus halotolerans TaxID=1631356 RepID=A0A0L6CFH8_9MICO|nr:MOSC domain-containing protein [Luteipulveratus halotolerans]KNX36439.1 hypothetical protein VV01_03605 [Luteipulveratus halotolerans]
MRLSALNIHPVKSTAIRPVDEAYVGRAGLRGDREWMVVDSTGTLVSAREQPSLFDVVADTPHTDASVTGALRLRHPRLADLALSPLEPQPVPVVLHKKDVLTTPAGAIADQWLREAIGRDDVRLMWCDDPTRRGLNPAYAQPDDHTAFADSAPLSLASTTSVRQLNDWTAETALDLGEPAPEPLPVQRFRANVIIEGADEPFAEDGWRRVRIGDVTFRVPAPIDRCVMTTIDPASLDRGKEPIRTLARHRRWDGKTWFAVKLVPDGEGTIRVGDELTVRLTVSRRRTARC